MQAISPTLSNRPYNADMQTGRPSKSDRSPFGQRVYEAREAKGLSLRQVAEALEVPLKTYANWERRNVGVRPELLSALSTILEVSTEQLLGSEQPSKKEGPTGKARKLFEEVSALPRHQQQRILATVEDMLIAQAAKQKAS
jgi:transcriptional regulator with XRE-family HTH domain